MPGRGTGGALGPVDDREAPGGEQFHGLARKLGRGPSVLCGQHAAELLGQQRNIFLMFSERR